MNQLSSALLVAIVLSFVTLGATLTFRWAGFPDLSVDGVFTLGAVALARSLQQGIAWPLAVVIACVAGSIVGSFTGLLAVKLRINALLASVLVLITLYTINYRLLGRANVPLFTRLPEYVDTTLGFLITSLTLLLLALFAFFVIGRSELGVMLRSVGPSAEFVRGLARRPEALRVILVSAAGATTSLSGALLATRYGFADVSMGLGVLLIAIATLLIGERLTRRRTVLQQSVAIFVGCIVYQLGVAGALNLGLSPSDVKLATGALVILLIALTRGERGGVFAEA